MDAAFSGSLGAIAASGSAWVDDLDDLFSISETFEKLDDPNSDWFAADKDVKTFFKDLVDSPTPLPAAGEHDRASILYGPAKTKKQKARDAEFYAKVLAVNEEDTTEKK